MTDPLGAMACRVEEHPFFLASVLAVFARSEKLDDAGLAAFLGCPPGRLAALKLCRAPREQPPGCQEDVEIIAADFGVSADRLADAVRRGQVIRRLRTAAPAGGTLLAARDGEPPAPAEDRP